MYADAEALAAHARGERVRAHLEPHGHLAIARGHLRVSDEERRVHVMRERMDEISILKDESRTEIE